MGYDVKLNSAAEIDIEVAIVSYSDLAPHLPKKFIDELYASLKKLAEHPQHYKYYDEI